MMTHNTIRIGVSAALFAILTACGGGPDRRDAYNAGELPVLTLAEDWRVGSTEDPDVGFSRIGPVAVDAGGNVYVLEQQDAEVRVLSATGMPLRTIGGPGEGPGEFGRPERLGIRGDTLWVNDPGLGRVTMFSRDGSVVRTFPSVRSVSLATSSTAAIASARGGVLRSDGFVHMEEPSAIVFLNRGEPLPDSLAVPILRFDRSGKMADTVAHWFIYLVRSADEGTPGRPAQTDMVLDPGPPADTPLRLRCDEDLILITRQSATSVNAASFMIMRIAAKSDTVYRRHFQYRPTTFWEEFVDSLVDARGALDLPTFQPPITAARCGDDGTLWLRREIDAQPRYRWLILAPDGTPRGHVDLSAASTIRWIGEDIIYAVERDEFDVPWLVRYRLRR